MKRAGLEPALIEHVVMGNVIQTEARDMYLARVAAIEAGRKRPLEVRSLQEYHSG